MQPSDVCLGFVDVIVYAIFQMNGNIYVKVDYA